MLDAVHVATAVMILLFSQAVNALDNQRIVDLTHPHGPDVVYWPTFPAYNFTALHRNRTEAGFWLEYNSFAMAEHSGTHMDAPCHICEGGRKVHEIPLEELVGPGVIINVQSKVIADPDYRVSVNDIQEWETKHDTIPEGAVVMMNSGWFRGYPNKTLVLGSRNHTDTSSFHFPGWHEDAIDWLLTKRKVHVVGSDTPATDYALSTTLPVHQLLCKADITGLENVANLDAIPESGSTIYVAPFNLVGGSGSPTRIFATVMTGNAVYNVSSKCLTVLMVMFYGFFC